MDQTWIKTQQEISPLIGEIAVSFAAAEQALDECAIVIHAKYAAARSIQKKLPWGLSQKLDFLKRCFSEIGELATFKDDALLVIQQMSDLADDRNFLIHGAADPNSRAPHGQLKMRKVLYEKSGPRFEERTYTVRKVWDIAQVCGIACFNAVMVAYSLTTTVRRK